MTSEAMEIMVDMAFKVIGGLGIFLFGMKNMSEGMQAIAGSRLRKLISSVTDNRISACGVGTAVTCLVQSSSVTTVMTVGFVSAGLMTLMQAIPVVMGANIGTTITGWILVLKIGRYGLPILGLAAFFFLFSKNERVRYTGMAIMGIGMVFFGLELMSSGFKPMRTMPEFEAWFLRFSADTYFGMWKCILAGCVLTCIVQSSSATLGITMGLASTGMINFQTAAALVLGENIGTTITAFLASIGAPTDAKRAAYAHIIFNICGVIWISSFFPQYLELVSKVVERVSSHLPDAMVMVGTEETYPAVRKGIAFVHSGFNIANTLIFLPFTGVLAAIVTRILPEKKKEVPHLTFLDIRMINSPAIAVEESKNEVIKMGDHVTKMMEWLKDVLKSDKRDEAVIKKLFHREEVLDVMQKEVTEFLSQMLSGNVSNDVIEKARMQLRLADEFESIGDYIATLLKLHLKKLDEKIEFSSEGSNELLALHDKAVAYVDIIVDASKESYVEVITKAHTLGDDITHDMKKYREKHLERMVREKGSPLASLIFTDMLNAYRRVKDHALNIAEAIAGEK